MKVLFIIPLILLQLVACDVKNNDKKLATAKKEKKLKTGISKTHYADGKLKSEISYVNGKQSGLAKSYYKNGNLWNEIEYLDNVKHGKAITYYENGKLCLESNYDQGLLNGLQKKYRADGKLQAEILYKDDMPAKGLKEYLKDGKLKSKYPKLIIEPVDNIIKKDQYVIKVYFEGKPKGATYYMGELDEGKFLKTYQSKLQMKDNYGFFEISIPPGAFMMEKLNFIGKATTANGNPYIAEKPFNLAIDNNDL